MTEPVPNAWLHDFVAMQSELPVVSKSSDNPHFRSKYADLPTIMEAIRPVLRKHGFGIMQPLEDSGDPRLLRLNTMLVHTSGHTIQSSTTMPIGEKLTPQAYGSAVTYLRRYALGAFLGIVTDEDDDANSSSGIDSAKASASTISDKQVKRGWAIATKAGYTQADVSKILAKKGIKGMENLDQENYNNFCTFMENNPKQTDPAGYSPAVEDLNG
jgi:hypothetical protein